MSERLAAEETGASLLRRIGARDREALGDLYDACSGLLFSIALRMLDDPGDAEEVLQEVFLQIWQRAGTFRPEEGSALSWVVAITRNRAIDRLRSRRRRSRMVEALQTMSEPVAEVSDAAGGFCLDKDSLRAIRAGVQGLPAEQRQAIELAFFGGLTHPEIAEALQQPLGTIKARIRRGMLKLRDSLKPYL